MPSARRTLQFLIRLSPEERELFEAAAAMEGQPMGTWLRATGLKQARRRIAEPGQAKGRADNGREP